MAKTSQIINDELKTSTHDLHSIGDASSADRAGLKNTEKQFISALVKAVIQPVNLAHHLQALNGWCQSLLQELLKQPIQAEVLSTHHPIQKLINQLQQSIESFDARWDKQWQQRLPAQSLARYFDDKLMFLVYGKFNAGKSSFCNYLAKRFAAQNQRVDFFVVNDGQIDYVAGPFQEGSTETTAHIQGVLLAERMVLLDTPGLHSLTEVNAALTQQFMESADGVLWFSSSTSPGQVQELDTLAQELRRRKPLLPIITRSDFIDEDIVNNEIVKVVRNKTQSNRQLQEQDLHERAAEKLGTLGVDPKVLQAAISVSVYAAQETATAQNGDEYCSALQQAGFYNFYAALTMLLEGMLTYKKIKPAEMLLHHLEENVLEDLAQLQTLLQQSRAQIEQEQAQLEAAAQQWAQQLWQNTVAQLPAWLDEQLAQQSTLQTMWSAFASRFTEQVRSSSKKYFVSYTQQIKTPIDLDPLQAEVLAVGELTADTYEAIFNILENQIAQILQQLGKQFSQTLDVELEALKIQLDHLQEIVLANQESLRQIQRGLYRPESDQ